MLWTFIGLLLFFWALGLLAHVGGVFINLLVAAALILFLYKFVAKRRSDL